MKDLTKNENHYGPSPLVRTTLKHLKPKDLYSYVRTSQLMKLLAKKNRVPKKFLTLTNGAEEALITLFKGMKKGPISLPKKTWPFYYEYLKPLRKKISHFALNKDFSYNSQEIINHVKSKKTKLLILCSPNNPTSSTITKKELEYILSNIPQSIIVAIDETYKGFGAGQDYSPLTKKYSNLILIRSFSKYYALAGARIGYTIMHPETKEKLGWIDNLLGHSIFIEKLGLATLNSENYYKQCAKKIIHDRDELITTINTCPDFKAYPSLTNFILIKSTPEKTNLLKKDFAQANISFFTFPKGTYTNHLRLGMGSAKDTRTIRKIFSRYGGNHEC